MMWKQLAMIVFVSSVGGACVVGEIQAPVGGGALTCTDCSTTLTCNDDGICDAPDETCGDCPSDCGLCPRPVCNRDGICDAPDESCANCADDCGACLSPTCNDDGVCDAPDEACGHCPGDCGECVSPVCNDDGMCSAPDETCANCPGDCGVCPPPTCDGNGVCDAPRETCSNCPGDCGACPPPSCNNDGVCDAPHESCESCANDCGVCRPAYNTGTGFFVLDGKLYDATGTEFIMRGVNKAHYDVDQTDALVTMNANAVRWILFDQATALQQHLDVADDYIAHAMVPIPGNWDGTCNSSVATLSNIVDLWVAQASAWRAYEEHVIINIANEWGPTDVQWRDAYIDAVARLRQAGYRHAIMIDAGGCGQNAGTIIDYAQAVFDSDPQRNVIFDVHVYGGFVRPATESWHQDSATSMAQLGGLGLPLVIGEFGPGRNIGESPTMITPATVITTADDRGWGWLVWAADDGNGPNATCNGDWFCMMYNSFGGGSGDNLTPFGEDVVLNPIYGMAARAETAAVFR